MKLNKEELGLGAAFGFSFVFYITVIPAVILGLVCAALWAVGGSGAGRAWRFVGVPVAALAALFVMRVPIQLLHALASTGVALGVLTMGYGIPSTQPPDAGSTLGRFFYKLAGGNERAANFLTRGFLALLLGLAYIPLAWIIGVAYLPQILGVKSYVAMIATLVVLHLAAVQFLEGEITL